SAFKDNRFQNLNNYFPDEVEWRVLQRRSSKDMQLVLERSSPDTLRYNLQRDFNQVMQEATGKGFNWTEWELADVQATRRDRKDPLLYSVQVNLTNATGAQETLWFEAVKVRGRFFLFKKLVFNPAPAPDARN
ncbi:MAG TPA: hypothetical protein VK927_02035, partial [Adhaeribacter sp.]|nr:hypothetical protein [Adhaeribacter sp.]